MGYQPGGRNRGGGNYYEGYSAADLNPYRPRYYSEPYDNSKQQQQQQQQQQQPQQQQQQQRQPQQQQPYYASSSPAFSTSRDPGTSAQAALRHFAGIARIVCRGKCEIANVSLASSVPLPPTPSESTSLVSPATAVEPTFDRSLCVETFPGMPLGPEVEAVLYDTRASRGRDASVAWCFSPDNIPVEMAEPLDRVWDDSERAKNCLLYTSPSPRD